MTDTTSSAPLLDINGSDIRFKPANPLNQAKPPIPPLETRTVLYREGSVNAKGAMKLPIDIECLEDIPIELRDGTVIYGDLWRRQGDARTPVILVYSPYSKRGGPFNANYDVTSTGFPKDQVSGLQRFESPDPAYWCRYGYMDMRFVWWTSGASATPAATCTSWAPRPDGTCMTPSNTSRARTGAPERYV
nr:hypothetical protein [Bifidobacterium simiarum]